uniref:Serine-threonine kinase receptor-associated protein n=1 Tax=Romanomermis culicivorax TaxID=13658 RepID=A0A915HJD5_ROMCU
MRPLTLKGHERSITKVKYNRDGDLLFTAAKDKHPCVWFAENGERLGSYDGHNGVIWCMDVSWDSGRLLTGSGDNMCIMWDVETGQKVHALNSPIAVRTVGFSYSANLFFYGTDLRTSNPCTLNFFDVRDPDQMTDGHPQFSIQCPYPKSRISSALWSHLDYMVITV